MTKATIRQDETSTFTISKLTPLLPEIIIVLFTLDRLQLTNNISLTLSSHPDQLFSLVVCICLSVYSSVFLFIFFFIFIVLLLLLYLFYNSPVSLFLSSSVHLSLSYIFIISLDLFWFVHVSVYPYVCLLSTFSSL